MGDDASMPNGLVTRVLAGFYDVTDASAKQMTRCRARGVFRKRGVTILVGDRVVYRTTSGAQGVIDDVLPRVTQLVRPPVANITKALLVFSIAHPEFQRYLLDKTLVVVAAAGLECAVALTKTDLASADEISELRAAYDVANIELIATSTQTGVGVEAVRDAITNHVTVFVGPSGTGKSSLANMLSPELGLRMGEISEKMGRGKHTTRHTELFQLAPDTYIADTAGFSQLQVDVKSVDLRRYFPEFGRYEVDCPYRSCQHIDEETCAIKQSVADGHLAATRYDSYRTLYEEIRHREATKY